MRLPNQYGIFISRRHILYAIYGNRKKFFTQVGKNGADRKCLALLKGYRGRLGSYFSSRASF
jgi:hypothetical protein